MRQQKRFTSERAIYAAIFADQRRINELVAESEKLETTGHSHLRSGNEGLADAGRGLLQQSERIRLDTIPRIEKKLGKLKEALAAIQTPLLFEIAGDDGGVEID